MQKRSRTHPGRHTPASQIGIRRNLDTVRLLHLFFCYAHVNNGTVSYSGVKGLPEHNEKHPEDILRVTNAYYYGVRKGYTSTKKKLCKKGSHIFPVLLGGSFDISRWVRMCICKIPRFLFANGKGCAPHTHIQTQF